MTNQGDQNNSRKDGNKALSLEDIVEKFKSSGLELDKLNGKLYLEAEKKHVRRTAEEFAAGAVPSTPGKSQRLFSLRIGIVHELNELISREAELQGVDRSDYVRAALRYALENQIDAKKVLNSRIELDASRYEPK